MGTMTLNNELSMLCPSGFHEMDSAERGGLQFIESGPGACYSDPVRHMIVSVGWKRVNALLRLILNNRDIISNMEARTRRPMRRYGYRLEGYSARKLDGKTANGFRFTYAAQGVDMYAESCVVESKGMLYYLHMYSRAALRDESLAVWEEILDSVRWGQ